MADEVNQLQRGKDVASRLFQEFAEQGHYKGRVKPSNTRQGIYAVTPNGQFLASCNTRSADRVAKMLRTALARWHELPRETRRLPKELAAEFGQVGGWADRYPADGLVLRVTTRDLPGAKQGRDWKKNAWNHDFAWFRKNEARRFVPEKIDTGNTARVPDPLVRRLVLYHLLDNVRGQVSTFRNRDIQSASLTTKIVSTDGKTAQLRITGATRAVQKGSWAVSGFRDSRNPTEQERGFATEILGFATWDLKNQRFTKFEAVAIGTRWGGTQFNGRAGDLDASPIGVALSLGSGDTSERTPPARVYKYGWR